MHKLLALGAISIAEALRLRTQQRTPEPYDALISCPDVLPDPAGKSDRPVSQDAEGAGKRLLVHNLFAMEAISIAEALGVPSLALSPCLVPQVAPASLQRHFKREHAALYAALTIPGVSLQISSPSAACTV